MNRVLIIDDERGVLKAPRCVLASVPCRCDGFDDWLQFDLAQSPVRAQQFEPGP